MKKFRRLIRRIRPLNLLILLAAGIINSIGVTMFLAPVQLYDSGISGTSMLLWQITPDYLSLSFFLLVLNIPLFLYGYKKQGPEFTLYSIFATTIYAASSFLITDVFPVDVSVSSPFAGEDLLLCALFGGVISGVGSGLTIRYGGAIDGVEVLAVIFAKRLGITVGTFVMIYNVALYLVVGIVLQSWTLPLYSIVTYCAAIKAVDFITEGLDKAKAVMIITKCEARLSKAISKNFHRGVTHLSAKGYYSGEESTAIYFVVNRFQIPRLKTMIQRIDPDAFVTISEVSDVFGSSLKE